MTGVPIKHINSLLPFSRDHGVGLVCAQRARRAACATQSERIELVEEVRSACRDTLIGYLEDEQWVLSPFIGDEQLRVSFHQRHKHICALSLQLCAIDLGKQRGLSELSMLADALDDYVRWAQHILFCRVEEGIDNKEAYELTKLALAIEAGRNRPTQQLHASITKHVSIGSNSVKNFIHKDDANSATTA